MTVEFEEIEHENYVTYDVVVNTHLAGELAQDVDGYFYFWFEQGRANNGSIPAWFFRSVADKLDEINKPWDDIVQNDPSIGHGEHNLEQGESV